MNNLRRLRVVRHVPRNEVAMRHDASKKIRLFKLTGTVRDITVESLYSEYASGSSSGWSSSTSGNSSQTSNTTTTRSFLGERLRLTLALHPPVVEYPKVRIAFCVMYIDAFAPSLMGRKIESVGARTLYGAYRLKHFRCPELDLTLSSSEKDLFGRPTEPDGWIYE